MADFPSPSRKSPTSYILGLTAFASKAFSDAEPAMSPTSVLKSPVWIEPGSGVGLGIVDSLTNDAETEPGSAHTNKKNLIVAKKTTNSKFALFGSELKIQIPITQHNTFSIDSQTTPMEFGIKTRNSQLGFGLSPKCSSGSPSISSAEMELSEDYTRVISRGGHVTKMTRIYDDCVVDSCFGDHLPVSSSSSSYVTVSEDENGVSASPNGPFGYQIGSFLSFCHSCRKSLGEGTDIYMYRGEKAFCSDECRYREMLMEEELGKNGAYGDDEFSSW